MSGRQRQTPVRPKNGDGDPAPGRIPLLLFAHTLALEERTVTVGASFADKELDICSSNQAERCKHDEIRGLGEQPVLGKDNQEYQRDNNPGLVPEGIGPFLAAGEEPDKFAGNDMAAVLIPRGTFRAERVENDKARQQYPDQI